MNKKMVGVLAVSMSVLLSVSPTFAMGSMAKGRGEVIRENVGLIGSNVMESGFSLKAKSGYINEGDTKKGGYWIRGKKKIGKINYVYSSYKSYNNEGEASVVNGEGDYKSGGYQPPKTFSTAKLKWTSAGTNKAYYDYQ